MRLLACLYRGPLPPKYKRVDLLGEVYIMNPPLRYIRPGMWLMWQGHPAAYLLSVNGGPRLMVPASG